jgi:flagellar secretion chaperone FliS
MRSAADHYLAEKVLSATPAELTGMLFDGAAQSLRATLRLQESEQWSAALERSLKAQRILAELRSSLNREAGGQIAADLDRLYAWALVTLSAATSGRNPQDVQAVLDVVAGLGSAWREGVLRSVPVPQPA